ncbi:ATP synthase subunit C lysine N-methyltransferase isoform X1 [Paroedura picta]|uniref:ATP synthase subunit C lysine N-methyltransferase isoform X1 n=1 Tax=Paroedura picta TaxID=143630 RepID=UPI004056D990
MSKILPGESQGQDEGSRPRKWGLWATGIIGGSLVVLYSIATPFVAPALRKHCLPFVPATPKQIDNVLSALNGRSGCLVDIGSGDGRIVIAAAKVGFKAVGYELNPWLVWYSRYHAWKAGVHHNAKFYVSDLWKVNFSQFTNVVIFGVPQMAHSCHIPLKKDAVQNIGWNCEIHRTQPATIRSCIWHFWMLQLEDKLGKELRPEAKVVVCRFPFPHWKPSHSTGEGIDTVWGYNSESFRMNGKMSEL